MKFGRYLAVWQPVSRNISPISMVFYPLGDFSATVAEC